jgi:hypothetical protein
MRWSPTGNLYTDNCQYRNRQVKLASLEKSAVNMHETDQQDSDFEDNCTEFLKNNDGVWSGCISKFTKGITLTVVPSDSVIQFTKTATRYSELPSLVSPRLSVRHLLEDGLAEKFNSTSI